MSPEDIPGAGQPESQKSSQSIFISYRRDDGSAWAGRLYDRLIGPFASDDIFMDVNNLAPGVDFVQALESSVAACDVLIVVIGRRWLAASDDKGERRLDKPEDFVRVEISTALSRGIPVIPALVDGAAMPQTSDLPEDLKSLARRNAIEISHTRFNSDSGRLIEAIQRSLEVAKAKAPRMGADQTSAPATSSAAGPPESQKAQAASEGNQALRPGNWMGTTKEIFISYARPDEKIAQVGCHALESAGYPCWIASRDLNAGLSSTGQAMQVLRETRTVVLFLSRSADASPIVLREIEFAARQKQPVVTVLLDQTNLNEDLAHLLKTSTRVEAYTENSDTTRLAGLVATVQGVLPGQRPSGGAISGLKSGTLRFGDFEIQVDQAGRPEELGKGGMGVTYRARQISLNRPVALKVITPQLLGDQEIRQRFFREALTAAKIDHPNVATVYARGQEGDAYFYAMQLVEGIDLERYVRKHGPLTVNQALSVTTQVAQALGAANAVGLIHRDVKPSNIMATQGRRNALRIKLIDFGLAKNIGSRNDEPTLSSASRVIGTLAFASPEQCRAGTVDTRSDLYSLGATLWYLLTSNLPFRGTTIEVSGSHLYQEPPFSELKDFPDRVIDLLRRLLAKDPKSRPQTPAELEDLVDELQQQLGPETAHVAPGNSEFPTRTTMPSVEGKNQTLIGSQTFESYVAPKSGTISGSHYLLLEEVREGLGGRLFRAQNQQSNDRQELGIKYLHPEIVANEDRKELVAQQVQQILETPHQNLVRYHTLELTAASPFLVRDWIHGFSLDQLLRWKQHLEPWEVSSLFDPFPALLDQVNQKGFALLELTLTKVFLTLPTEIPAYRFPALIKAKSTDLSTAQLKLNPLSLGRLVSASRSTGSSYYQTVISTSRIMALAQANVDLHPKASIPLFGQLIYEMLVGHPPPDAYLQGEYKPISQLDETGSQILQRACVQSTPTGGFTSCSEFWAALRPKLVGRRPKPNLPSVTESARNHSVIRESSPKKMTPSQKDTTLNQGPDRKRRNGIIALVGCAGVCAVLVAIAIMVVAPRIFPGSRSEVARVNSSATVAAQPGSVESTPVPSQAASATAGLLARAQASLAAHDYESAATGLREAAMKGDKDAMRQLGDMYHSGLFFNKDDQRAAEWYQKAADAGDPYSMANLAFLYENGKGVTQDYDRALFWYEKAAAAGDARAMYLLGRYRENGTNIQQDYQKARAWYQEAAEAGDRDAMFSLAGFYFYGHGGKKDDTLAAQWYQKSADAGHVGAMANLAYLYEKGLGLQQDLVAARKWYQKAADAGNESAKKHLESLPPTK